MLCNHVHNEYLGKLGSASECAAEAAKKEAKFILYGKQHNAEKCWKVHTSKCTSFRFDWNMDYYQVNLNLPKKQGPIEYPDKPAVRTDWANLKSSPWMNFEAGKMYPFKLERKVSGRTDTTGVDGWKELGLECKTLSGKGPSGEDGGAYLPKAMYLVTMVMKKYPLLASMPVSKSGYKLAFGSRSVDVKTDEEVGKGLVSLLGATCKYTATSSEKIFDFEGGNIAVPSASAYCGLQSKSPDLTPEGYFKGGVRLVGSGETSNYKLKDFPYLHMCYQIEPKAVVNIIIKGRVGYRKRIQEWSVGMTDPRFKNFHHDRKRAAQWPIKVGSNGTTTGSWECGSINLYGQMQDWESYERRFHDVDYGKGAIDSHVNAPTHQLRESIEIHEIWLGSGYLHRGKFQPLKGKVSIDMLVASKSQFQVSQTAAAPVSSYPFSSMEGVSTNSGWKVEWFSHYRDWL
jgi:hypothetical protein